MPALAGMVRRRARAIIAPMFFDLAIEFDPVTKRGDLALGEDGDLAIDETSITPVLLSVGLDARASEEDVLPVGRGELLVPAAFGERRGWAGDALDPAGERTGSLLWLLDRAKATETTRLMVEFWLAACLRWAERETGAPAEIEVKWLARETLFFRVLVAGDGVELTQGIA